MVWMYLISIDGCIEIMGYCGLESGSSSFNIVQWYGLYADLAFLVYLGQCGANMEKVCPYWA